MKKIILSLTLALTLSVVFAQNKTVAINTSNKTTVLLNKYYYYPQKEVYYNEASGHYFYYDRPTRDWIGVHELPSSYQVNDQMERVAIIYNGTEVWKDHKKHKREYKVKKNGTLRIRSEVMSVSYNY